MSNRKKNKLPKELSNLIDAFEKLEKSPPDQVLEENKKFVTKLAKFQQNLTLLKTAEDNDYENIESRVAIYSVPDFLTYIGRFSETNKNLKRNVKKALKKSSLFYRGISKTNPLLEPKLFWKDKDKNYLYNVEKEATFLSALMSEKPLEFQQDKNNFERLSRMRHYGAPTRLLDITSNPLIALYFAAQSDDKNKKSNGEVLTLFINNANIKYSNSDTIQCISALSALSGRKKQKAISLLNEFNFKKEKRNRN